MSGHWCERLFFPEVRTKRFLRVHEEAPSKLPPQSEFDDPCQQLLVIEAEPGGHYSEHRGA
jgi:hypothetical protein